MSQKIYNFKESVKIGENGEKKIIEYVENTLGGIVEDVRDKFMFRQNDIDILVTYKYATDPVAVEIKNDTYTSGNFFFETKSCIETNTPGCLYKTKAKQLYYYFENFNELYIIDMPSFLKWFEDNKSRFKRKEVKNYRRNGSIYTTEGYIFSKSYMEATFKEYRKVSL